MAENEFKGADNVIEIYGKRFEVSGRQFDIAGNEFNVLENEFEVYENRFEIHGRECVHLSGECPFKCVNGF